MHIMPIVINALRCRHTYIARTKAISRNHEHADLWPACLVLHVLQLQLERQVMNVIINMQILLLVTQVGPIMRT